MEKKTRLILGIIGIVIVLMAFIILHYYRYQEEQNAPKQLTNYSVLCLQKIVCNNKTMVDVKSNNCNCMPVYYKDMLNRPDCKFTIMQGEEAIPCESSSDNTTKQAIDNTTYANESSEALPQL